MPPPLPEEQPPGLHEETGEHSQGALPFPNPAPDNEHSSLADDDPIDALAARSLKRHLTPEEEQTATDLLRSMLEKDRGGVEQAVEKLPKLPWGIAVTAVSEAWPQMKTTLRARLIGGLAKHNTEAARRVRLSLARGLFKLDLPAAMKLATGVAKEMRDKETGSVGMRDAQIFTNVFIGRAKPWVAQTKLDDLRPADADALVHCALMAAFSLPHAPAAQLGVLKWAMESGRADKLQAAPIAAAAKAISRWNTKWQNALRKEVTSLPPEIEAVLKPPTEEGGSSPVTRNQDRPAGLREQHDRRGEEIEPHPEESPDEQSSEGSAEPSPSPQPRREPDRQRPVYESKTVPSQPRRQPSTGGFNLGEALKQIDAHVSSLRAELQTAQGKLRQRDDDQRPPRRGSAPRGATMPVAPGEPSMEELARLNRQLDVRNHELEERIAELTSDSEDRAATLTAPGAGTPDNQLKTLLTLKLQEDFEDFSALEKEAPDAVVQQHYRTLLRHVFETLRKEGVRLVEPTE